MAKKANNIQRQTMKKSSLIFDIKRYSINDGPGIRTTVFFKGCPLSCAWCHNPESQSSEVQKLYSLSKCIGCGSCVEECPEKALILDPVGGIITDSSLCTVCGKCALVCPTKAIEMSGYHETVEKIMQAIKRETVMMDTSGGGVTFSGGEPLLHPEMLMELLKKCAEEGIHRAVDTSGFVKWEILAGVAPHIDLFLYDIKHMNSWIHKEFTGVPNDLILSNLIALAQMGSKIIIRIPLVEGVNADEKNMEETAAFIASLAGEPIKVNLLPYHSIAARKYEKLGGSYYEGKMKEPAKKTIQKSIEIFARHGITATVGG